MASAQNAEQETSNPPSDPYETVSVGICWQHGPVRVTANHFMFPVNCPICNVHCYTLSYRKVHSVATVQES